MILDSYIRGWQGRKTITKLKSTDLGSIFFSIVKDIGLALEKPVGLTLSKVDFNAKQM